jgi:hypothetical protein
LVVVGARLLNPVDAEVPFVPPLAIGNVPVTPAVKLTLVIVLLAPDTVLFVSV